MSMQNSRSGGDRYGDRASRTPSEFFEKVVHINRCAKVVKGGRRFSFTALVVVGDRKGRVGIGHGKANEVPDAIKKGTERAKKRFQSVTLKGDSIPHDVEGHFDGGRVLLRPASTGTGIIAGASVRSVLEAAGIKNILTKSMGSKNHIAVVHATLAALRKLRGAEHFGKLRGKGTPAAEAVVEAPAEAAAAS